MSDHTLEDVVEAVEALNTHVEKLWELLDKEAAKEKGGA